jgi:hypothetical protein
MRVAVLLLVGLSCRAESADPVDLIRESIKAEARNRIKAASYTHQEYLVRRHLDSKGKETERTSETWDVIALEGSTYRKLIRKNDKPLSEKEQKKEDERMQKEQERRKKETASERRRRLFDYNYSYRIPYPKIPGIYDLKLLREDSIGGRAAYVIECVPKPAFVPNTPDEKESMNYRMVLWIDKQDLDPAQYELEVIGDHSRLRKGSTATLARAKVNEEAWMAKETRITFAVSVMKMIAVHGETNTTFSNYKKFQVDSSIVETERTQ